jgi:hypothetical protein
MPKVPDFHFINEAKKPSYIRVYHDNSACASGLGIPQNERHVGNGRYKLCDVCKEETKKGH